MPGRLTPRRSLGWATLVNMAGSGAYVAGLTVFLVQTRSVSAAVAAACILISTLGGKFGALPFASMVDRLGGRTTYVSSKVVSGIAAAALLVASSPVLMTGCLIVYGLFSAVGGTARNLIIRDIARTETKVYRAKLRSLANTGIVLGSSVAAAALAWDVTRGAAICMALNAVSCVACSILVATRIPATTLPPPEHPSTNQAQTSRPTASVWRLLVRPRLTVFLAISAIFSVMTPVLTFAVPLWVSGYVYPRDAWPVGILVATNAIIVIAFQVPVSRYVDQRYRSEAVMVLAGVMLGSGLAVAGASALVSGPLSLVFVTFAVILVSLAEVLFSAATTELLFAPDMASHLTRTSSLFNFACAVGEAVGPILLLAIVLRPAAIGWFAIAAAMWACAFFYIRAVAMLSAQERHTQTTST